MLPGVFPEIHLESPSAGGNVSITLIMLIWRIFSKSGRRISTSIGYRPEIHRILGATNYPGGRHGTLTNFRKTDFNNVNEIELSAKFFIRYWIESIKNFEILYLSNDGLIL